MTEIRSKLPDIGINIFTQMSQMARDYGAINLSQGFPNFPIDKRLQDTYQEVLKGEHHQYQPMAGNPKLLDAIADKVQLHYGRQLLPDREILVTTGGSQGIYTVLQALIHQDEEVIVIDPAYDCYAPAIQMAGGQARHVRMRADFSVDWEQVERTVSKRTKMLIINNPHNPTGTVLGQADFDALEDLMERHPQVWLLSDKVYEFIHFEKPHISVHHRKALHERSIVISSFGKTFHVTGWKVGYVVAPERLLNEVKKVHQFLVFCVNSTAQETLANYLPSTDLFELKTFYQTKRDFFQERMSGSRFELLDCQGTYFQTARYGSISDLPDIDFAKQLVQEHGVAAIPISVFNHDKRDDRLIRFCFAKTDETLIQATERLCKI